MGYPEGYHGTVHVLAEVTDHILSARSRPDLFDAPTNHQSLCRDCNARKAIAQEGGFGRYGHTPSVDAMRYVVCGPPGAGKTTWVQQQAQPGDVVWDLDAVAATMAQMPVFPRPQPLVLLLRAMRASVVAWLQEHPQDLRAFLIVADVSEASDLCRAVRGTLVSLNQHIAKVEKVAPQGGFGRSLEPMR